MDRNSTEEHIYNFCNKQSDCVWLHFSGHGEADQEEVWLIPVDCDGKCRKYKLSDILDKLFSIPDVVLIIITLDMCQTSPVQRGVPLIDAIKAVSTRTMQAHRAGNALDRIMRLGSFSRPSRSNQDLLIFTAGERGNRVADGGLFSQKLAEFLKFEDRELMDMARWVTQEVVNASKVSGRIQHPVCSSAKLKSQWIITRRSRCPSSTLSHTEELVRAAFIEGSLQDMSDSSFCRVFFRELRRRVNMRLPSWSRCPPCLRPALLHTWRPWHGAPEHHLIVLDGNIGCGKTTILNALRARAPEGLQFRPEPVAKDAEGTWWPFLEHLYEELNPETCSEDPGKKAAAGDRLENTVWQHHLNISKHRKAHTFTERGLESAAKVFCEGLRKRNCLSDRWYHFFQKDFELLMQDSFNHASLVLYFRLPFDEALSRIKARVRAEGRTFEAKIDLAYLQQLHEAYDKLYANRSDVIFVDMMEGEGPEEVLRKLGPQVRSHLEGRASIHDLELIMRCFPEEQQ